MSLLLRSGFFVLPIPCKSLKRNGGDDRDSNPPPPARQAGVLLSQKTPGDQTVSADVVWYKTIPCVISYRPLNVPRIEALKFQTAQGRFSVPHLVDSTEHQGHP